MLKVGKGLLVFGKIVLVSVAILVWFWAIFAEMGIISPP